MSNSNPNKVIAAGALGFLAGILYAPRKGTDTQDKIKSQIDNIKSKAIDTAESAKEKIGHMRPINKDISDTAENNFKQLAEDIAP